MKNLVTNDIIFIIKLSLKKNPPLKFAKIGSTRD